MAELKDRLRADLTASMKERNEVRTRTLRMVLTEIAKEEVSGTASRELGDAEVTALVAAAIAETGAAGPSAMGQVMKTVTPSVAGRAEGARVAAEVRRQLAPR